MILPPIHSFIANALFYSCRRTRIPERAADVDDRAPPERASLSPGSSQPPTRSSTRSPPTTASTLERSSRRSAASPSPPCSTPSRGEIPGSGCACPMLLDVEMLGWDEAWDVTRQRRSRVDVRVVGAVQPTTVRLLVRPPPAQKVFTREEPCVTRQEHSSSRHPACLPRELFPKVHLRIPPP